MRRLPAAATIATLLAAATATAPARGDALPPPTPIRCPAGSSVRQDHGGTHCVKDPPKNCPVGWQGVSGGTCNLSVCETAGDSCGPGKTCRDIDACAYDTESAGSQSRDPTPRKVRHVTDVCGGTRACAAPGRCRKIAVCLPDKGTPAPRPSNGGDADLYSFTSDPDGASSAAAPTEAPPPTTNTVPTTPATGSDPASAQDPRPPGRSGGCAGCASTPASSARLSFVPLLVIVGALVRRLRR